MRFVPVKTIEQQTICQLHRIRQLLVKQKTMHVNALRGHLAELGIIRARGLNKVSELMRLIEDAADDGLPARRLATIPGVGPVTATALATVIGDIGRFRSGRHLAAYLGLVPLQHSSGGKERLGAISRRGDAYLRTLLMHGARAVVRIMKPRPASADDWIGRLLQRRPVNVAVAAQANKTARIAWAVLAKAEDYRRPATAAM